MNLLLVPSSNLILYANRPTNIKFHGNYDEFIENKEIRIHMDSRFSFHFKVKRGWMKCQTVNAALGLGKPGLLKT